MEDLLQLIKADAEELEIQFRRASVQGRGTPQEISDFRENALQSFLSNYYPFPYRVAKGGILDSFGSRSASVDCVLVHPDHPYTIDRREKFKIILAEGVNAAIEVKPDISAATELHRGLEQGLTVKALRRKEMANLGDHSKEAIDYSKRVPFIIFSMKAKSDIRQTAEEVLDYYESKGIEALDQVDAIVVNGVGVISHYPVPEVYPWGGVANSKIGWFLEEWQEDTLAGFLFRLNALISPRTEISAPILSRYLRNLKVKRVQQFAG